MNTQTIYANDWWGSRLSSVRELSKCQVCGHQPLDTACQCESCANGILHTYPVVHDPRAQPKLYTTNNTRTCDRTRPQARGRV